MVEQGSVRLDVSPRLGGAPAIITPARRFGTKGFAALAGLALLALGGCQEDGYLPKNSRHWVALSPEIQRVMAEKNLDARAPILIRAFKKESELEVWKADASGEYQLLKTYPMCRWSGQLGPKKFEGDRQVPEGFYSITPGQMNPNSAYYLAFNIGYPNAYDRAYGRTGSQIMVHGVCSSRGCFAMTDKQVADIYALTREAFAGGQKSVQMQSLPFRFTPENLAKYRADENLPFWKNLKEGADHFDVTKREPQVGICGRSYVFNATPGEGAKLDAQAACPPLKRDEALVALVKEKDHQDSTKVAALVHAGTRAVKRIYQDGDQHPFFRHTAVAAIRDYADRVGLATAVPSGVSRVDDVSQPDALALGAIELPVEQTRGLNREQLIAKAAQTGLNEVAPAPPVVAEANRPEIRRASETQTTQTARTSPSPQTSQASKVVAGAPAAKANQAPGLVAPPPSTASALLADEPRKGSEPVFYQRWLGSLGSLTANSADVGAATQSVEAPIPPKAPTR